MNSNHGGSREGAGRPIKTQFEIEEPTTPLSWLWLELARRLDKKTVDEIHREFNKRSQVYQKDRIARGRSH
jgi:hypothetical protein